MKFISIKTIFNDFLNNTNETYLDEDLLLQWSSDCLDLIGAYSIYVPQMILLNVQDYKATLPDDYVETDLVLLYTPALVSNSCQLNMDVKEFITPLLGTACSLKTELITEGCDDFCNKPLVVTDASAALISMNPWLGYNRVVEVSNAIKSQNNFIPMKYARRTFNKSLLENCITYNTDALSYSINGNNIVCEFKTGKILLLYIGKQVDENNYPMIPNLTEVINAIFYYIEHKIAYVDYKANKDNTTRQFFADVTQLKNEYMQRAKSALNTPSWELAMSMKELMNSPIPHYERRFKNARN